MSSLVPAPDSGRPLRLLALDGGGVRGLVSLLILSRLMHRIDDINPPKPCDVFDIIAGTSTGGLIAIMLGRLKMDVKDAINTYTELSRKVFVPKPGVSLVRKVLGSSTFNHEALEGAIKGIIGTCDSQGSAPDRIPLLERNPKCKIFVCATMANAQTQRLRSYHSPIEEHIHCTIWEAARATSAAPLFFDPITFSDGSEFRDGAFRDNNPIDQLLEEVMGGFPGREIGTIVSLGTGVPSSIKLSNSLARLTKTCAKIATDTEQKAEQFAKLHCGPGGWLQGKYFRFNVAQGLQGIGLGEWQELNTMYSNTRSYLHGAAQLEMLEACSRRLRASLDEMPSTTVESVAQNYVTNECSGSRIQLFTSLTSSQQLPQGSSHSSGAKKMRANQRPQKALEKLFEKLYFEKFEDRYSHIKPAHQDTCGWLLANAKFQDWLDEQKMQYHNGILWLKGNPGTGKSTMMKFAVSKLKELYPKDIQIFFFFNARGGTLEKHTVGMYRSLLFQLLGKLTRLKEVFNNFSRIEVPEADVESWTVPQLQLVLLDAIRELERHRLWVLVDALDEGNEAEVREMITFLGRLGEEARRVKVQMRVFFASRHYPKITIPKKVELILDQEREHSRDIERYIQSKLCVANKNEYQELKSEVNRRASGVFLWVVLVIEILNTAGDHGMNQRTKLEELPNDLGELFRGILTRDLKNLRGMQLCVQWVLFAQKPLTRQELYFAVMSTGNANEVREWSHDHVTIEIMDAFILSCSKGLVQISGSTVQFIHETVRHFLLHANGLQFIQGISQHFRSSAHDILKMGCLNCISSSRGIFWGYEPPTNSEDLDKLCEADKSLQSDRGRYWSSRPKSNTEGMRFPFFRYALRHLLVHANAADDEGGSQVPFLREFQLQPWLYLRKAFLPPELFFPIDGARSCPLDGTLLYTLARMNLGSLIKALLREDPRLDIERGYPSSPIRIALRQRNGDAIAALLTPSSAGDLPSTNRLGPLRPDGDEIYQLLKNYIHAHKQQAPNSPILQFFFQWGDETDVLTLLRSGRFPKDGNILVSMRCSPLAAAAEKGYGQLTQFLLDEKNLDVNLQDGDLGLPPLSRACRNGRLQVVKALLSDTRVNVNIKCKTFEKPALSYAAEKGYFHVVEELLHHPSIEVNLADKEDRTPLFYAARKGHYNTVQLFIGTTSVEAMSRDSFNRTALFEASLHGHENVVRQLIESGRVTIEAEDLKNDRTPLSVACQFRYHAIARILRAHMEANGLSTTQHTGSIQTAGKSNEEILWQAAVQGDHLLVRTLLETGGVDLNFRGAESGRTPLWCAAEQGHESVVKLLVRISGIDLEARDTKNGQTPLCVAARYGHREVVGLLLASRGVDLDSEDSYGRTPLIWADLRDDDLMKQMLLDGQL